MSRGGARNGRPGASYPNRSDLTGTKPQAAVAIPGQSYGQQSAQLTAQKAVPSGAQPSAGPPAPGGAVGEAAPPGITPGSLGPLTAPTQRPDEPLTAGVPVGPGPAGLSLPAPPPSPLLSAVAALNSLGDRLPPNLRGTVVALQAAQGNGPGA